MLPGAGAWTRPFQYPPRPRQNSTAEAEQQIGAAKQRALSEMHGIATEVARSVTEKVTGSAADPANLAAAVDRALAERAG